MNPADKLSDGFELFEVACGVTREGIQRQFPCVNNFDVERILRERLALQTQREMGQWRPQKPAEQ